MGVNRLHKGYITNPCQLPNIWYSSSPSFNLHIKVVAEEDVAVTESMAAEAAQVVANSNSLLSDTQYHVLPSQNPGLEQIVLSGDPLDCFPCAPPEGEKSLSVSSLPEREKTLCVQSPLEGEETPCVQSPPEGEKLCVYSLRIYPHKFSYRKYILKKR